jgi:hypothetical protein
MVAAYLPLLATASVTAPSSEAARWIFAVLPSLAAALLLATGTMIAFPLEMEMIVALWGGRLVATHYGVYNTASASPPGTCLPAPPWTRPGPEECRARPG